MVNRRRFLLTAAAVLPAGWWLRWATRNTVVVVNESGRAVTDLTVGVFDYRFRVAVLAAGETVTYGFRATEHEDVFCIRGHFADGTHLSDSAGYVVWEEFGRTFTLVIGADGMVRERVG